MFDDWRCFCGELLQLYEDFNRHGAAELRQTGKSSKKYAEEQGIEYLIEFAEEKSAKNFTGRKQFNKLDKLLQSGDTVVFKDLSRFTREAENGYIKYMEWLARGVNIVFLDNPTISSDYIRQMMNTAESLDLVAKTAMEGIIKLLLMWSLTGRSSRGVISQRL